MKPRDKMEIGAEVALHGTKGDVTGFNDQFVTVRVPRRSITVIEPMPEPGIYVAADGLAVNIRTDETMDTLRRVIDHHGPLERLTRMPTRAEVEAVLNGLQEATSAVMSLLTRGQP